MDAATAKIIEPEISDDTTKAKFMSALARVARNHYGIIAWHAGEKRQNASG